MKAAEHSSRLRFLKASQLEGPAGDLAGVPLESGSGEALGTLAGVLIDPPARRVRYFVVERPGWLRRRHYLISTDCPARVESDTLRLDLDARDLSTLEEFDRHTVPPFSDEDTVDAMFGRVA